MVWVVPLVPLGVSVAIHYQHLQPDARQANSHELRKDVIVERLGFGPWHRWQMNSSKTSFATTLSASMARMSSACCVRTARGREEHQNRPSEHIERCELYANIFAGGFCTHLALEGSSLSCSFSTDVENAAHAIELFYFVLRMRGFVATCMCVSSFVHFEGRASLMRCIPHGKIIHPHSDTIRPMCFGAWTAAAFVVGCLHMLRK
jgi:hypothetical protein